ncbi:TolC family protein [Flavobacterium oreochromis]|uniref:TolC family protein n=1 Tax=Flavobacterium oreochromis TaxID=2906078 RepID=UPI0038591ED5
MYKKVFSIFLLILSINTGNSQRVVTIDEVHKNILSNSNKSKIIENDFLKSNIQSTFYRISLLPKVSVSVNLPYQRSITEIIQTNGSQKFIERNFLNSSMNLSISQVVPFTGGTLSLSSSLNNALDFNNKISSFSSNWGNISYYQTINGYNSFKWSKKLNPLRIRKNSIDYLKQKLKLKYEVSKLYSETQLIQLKIELIQQNVIKTEKLLFELEEKFKLGRITKIELEQVKIALEQFRGELEVNILQYNSGVEVLKDMIGSAVNEDLYLTPIIQEDFFIDKDLLIKAILDNDFDIEKAIKILEIDSNADKIKKEGAVSVNLQLGLGLNSTASDLSNLYNTPSQSQFITIGTKIPILDWGKARKNYNLAKLEKENLELMLNEEEEEIGEHTNEMMNYKLTLTLQKKIIGKTNTTL